MEKTEWVYFQGNGLRFLSIFPLEKAALFFSRGLRNQQPSRRARVVICTFANAFACLIRVFFELVRFEFFGNLAPRVSLRMKTQRFEEK
jgi:hypothetical protein